MYSDKAGHPPLPTRLMAGLSILKPMHDLSDEDPCARRVENPYRQLFRGEEVFPHKLTFDRLSLTRAGAAKPADFSKAILGSSPRTGATVQPKAATFPTDAKLMHRARERLVRLARKTGVELRQSCAGSANTR